MKYIGFIILFFSFLLPEVVEDHAAEAKAVEKTDVHSFGQEKGRYASERELPVLYGMEQDAERLFSSFRSNWIQARQSIIERTIAGLKRMICLVSSRDTMLMQQQYALFNHVFLYSKKSCSSYYVYAMRRIII